MTRPERHCPMRMSSRSSSPRWKVSRRGGPTGAPEDGRARWRQSASGHLRVARGIDLRRPAVHREGAGHCRPLPVHPTTPLSCHSTKSLRFKWSERSRSCRWTWVGPNARRTTTSAPGGPLRGAQRRRPARSSSAEGFRELSARSTSGWTPPSPCHVILDNSAKRWVARHPRFQFHFTPTPGSTLSSFFGLLTEHALRAAHCTHALRHAISAYGTPTMTRASLSSGRKQPTRSSRR